MAKPSKPKQRRPFKHQGGKRGSGRLQQRNFSPVRQANNQPVVEQSYYTSDAIEGRPIVLFDNDDFYGLTLDMVLFNLKQTGFRKVHTRNDFNRFNADLQAGKYQKGIYIVDEYFADTLKIDLDKFLTELKQYDKEAVLICYTVSDEGNDMINLKDKYDYVVIKSGLANDNSVIRTLSEILGVEFTMDNSDPEYEATTN